jgi:dihydrofolate reductase
MAKLLCTAMMSLDGFIAGPGGDMGWVSEHFGPNPELDGLVERIGSLLVGRRTFGGDDPYKGVEGREGKPFGGGWEGEQFVLTHRPPASEVPGVTFVTDLARAVALAKAAARGKYVNVLGADTTRQCLEAGVLDEIFLCLAPVLLGAGVRLFDLTNGARVGLERLGTTELPHVTNLWFRVTS